MRIFSVILQLLLPVVFAQQAKEGTAGDAQKMVTIRRIIVEGTRLPPLSVIRLAEIKVGDQVNFMKLNDAMRRVTKVGLINSIDFEYESLENKETDVVLHMKCVDVTPLAKASIQIPNVIEDHVWAWLAQLDPLFMQELPPTEAAIAFYAHWIGKYLESHGQPKFQETSAVIADSISSTGGKVTDRLVFKVTKLRGVKK